MTQLEFEQIFEKIQEATQKESIQSLLPIVEHINNKYGLSITWDDNWERFSSREESVSKEKGTLWVFADQPRSPFQEEVRVYIHFQRDEFRDLDGAYAFGDAGCTSLVEVERKIEKWFEPRAQLSIFDYITQEKEVKEERMEQEKLKIILCEAGKEARVVEIEDSLKSFQNIVGGFIEEYAPFEDDVALICDDEGKMKRLPLNRAVRDEDNSIIDVIAGDFFICYAPIWSEKFLSLPEDLEKKYMEMFRWPEQIFLKNGKGVEAIKYNPDFRKQEVKNTRRI